MTLLGTALSVFAVACGSDSTSTSIGLPPPGEAGSAGKSALDPNAPPTVSLLDAHPVLTDTRAEVVVELSKEWKEAVTVGVVTVDDTAKGDPTGQGDYRPWSGTVTLAAGQRRAGVGVDVRTPYKKLTLDTALDKRFKTKLVAVPPAIKVARGEGVVTLAHAGMVIETPLASGLLDGDIARDLNGDGKADLALTGRGGRAAVLLTPGTTFEEAGHVVVDDVYLDGKRAFSYPVDFGSEFAASLGAVASDHSMSADLNRDGLADLIVVGERAAHVLYGRAGAFPNFTAGDARLADGVFGTRLADIEFFRTDSIQVGDWDGDGFLDWGQAHTYSSAAGGADRFVGHYGAVPAGPVFTSSEANTFSFRSGTTAVGVASLSNGARPGGAVDLNGDGIDDLVFVGLAANDGQFGGDNLYVRFGHKARITGKDGTIAGTLDGTNGFQISHADYLSDWSSYGMQDSGDLNGDGVDDMVMLGGGVPLTVVFGKKTPYAQGNYPTLASMAPEAAFFDTDKVTSARCGDLNADGIDDLVFVSENKLRVLWGKVGLAGREIRGTQYPEMGEVEIDPASGLDNVVVVGDLDGDGAQDVVLLSATFAQKTGAALVVFGRALTPSVGGPPAPPIVVK